MKSWIVGAAYPIRCLQSERHDISLCGPTTIEEAFIADDEEDFDGSPQEVSAKQHPSGTNCCN